MTETYGSWRHLLPLERAALRRLVAVNFHGSAEVWRQLQECAVREIDENGSLEIAVPPKSPRALVSSRVPAEGEYQDSDCVTVHVLLHVVEGVVKELEFYKEDGTTVHERDRIAEMEVFSGE